MRFASENPATTKTGALARVTLAYLVALAAAAALVWALKESHPLLVAALADGLATAVVFGFSVLWNNSSVYDPYWSVAPIPIALFWAWIGQAGGAPLARQLLILLLVFLWGTRLTVNWILRWEGLRDEDFRYVRIRDRTGRAYWPASFISIHLMPTIWVFLGLLPLYPALATAGSEWGSVDVLAAGVTLAAIAIETVADFQLRRFQRGRRERGATLATGLWAWSRHPNYFGEVLFWWGMFLFGLAAAPGWWWTMAGAISVTGLFAFVSVPWMDRRMLAGHPEYAQRIKTTSCLIPWPPCRR